MNTTSTDSTITTFMDMSNHDLELVSVIQSGASFVATMIILFRVMDFGSLFKRVRDKRSKIKKEKERKELERVRKLINSVKHNNEVDIDDLLSDNDDEETEINDAGVMKIARKKTRVENKV